MKVENHGWKEYPFENLMVENQIWTFQNLHYKNGFFSGDLYGTVLGRQSSEFESPTKTRFQGTVVDYWNSKRLVFKNQPSIKQASQNTNT